MEIPCRVFSKEAFYLLTLSYSSSCNLTPPISLFLIGWHLIFCPSTWPRCCNSPRKCTLVKYKGRQKADCRTDNLLLDKNFLNSHKSAKVAGWCLHVAFFFSVRVFLNGDWQLTGQQGRGGDHFLLHSTTSTRLRTFRYLFATLYVRWLSHIFNRTACIYQIATRWDLPPYRITIWLIDDVKLVFLFVYLMISY